MGDEDFMSRHTGDFSIPLSLYHPVVSSVVTQLQIASIICRPCPLAPSFVAFVCHFGKPCISPKKHRMTECDGGRS